MPYTNIDNIGSRLPFTILLSVLSPNSASDSGDLQTSLKISRNGVFSSSTVLLTDQFRQHVPASNFWQTDVSMF